MEKDNQEHVFVTDSPLLEEVWAGRLSEEVVETY